MDIYHALNRGVDKRIIFLDDQDKARFVHDLYEFNSTKPANNIRRSQMNDIVSRSFEFNQDTEKLVAIHGWCLMSNHYHLLLSELIDGGLSQFIRKMNVGYAKYFNERYKRTGTLFQGRTKKILIDNDAYMLHILNYIHLNPLDFSKNSTTWRERTIVDYKDTLNLLHQYRWSSFQDYAGVKNFPSIIYKDLFEDIFQGQYIDQLQEYIKDIDIQSINKYTLE